VGSSGGGKRTNSLVDCVAQFRILNDKTRQISF
jgi:hypothetical protein